MQVGKLGYHASHVTIDYFANGFSYYVWEDGCQQAAYWTQGPYIPNNYDKDGPGPVRVAGPIFNQGNLSDWQALVSSDTGYEISFANPPFINPVTSAQWTLSDSYGFFNYFTYLQGCFGVPGVFDNLPSALKNSYIRFDFNVDNIQNTGFDNNNYRYLLVLPKPGNNNNVYHVNGARYQNDPNKSNAYLCFNGRFIS